MSVFTNCLLVALASLALSPADRQAPDASDVVVSYRVAPSFTLHEPIVAFVAIENRGRSVARVDLGENWTGNFAVTSTAPLPATSHEEGAGGLYVLGVLDLAPGQRYEQPLLLNDWFQFERLGDYEIGVRINGMASAAQSSQGNPLRFRVLPRNEQVLQATCARLAADITTQLNVSRQNRAARQLAAVNDLIGIRYIRETLSATNHVDNILLDALVRMGGPEAKRTVEALTSASDEERAAMARDALRRGWR